MTSISVFLLQIMIVLQLIIMKTCSSSTAIKVAKKKDRLYISICITGKLTKLDLLSKIHKIFIPNALLGHHVHVFMLLHSDSKDDNKGPYSKYGKNELQSYVWNHTTTNGSNFKENFVSRVKYAAPSQDKFEIISPESGEDHKIGVRKNLHWMNGLRDCVKWMQATEYEQGFHYDLVVKLRYLIFSYTFSEFMPLYVEINFWISFL